MRISFGGGGTDLEAYYAKSGLGSSSAAAVTLVRAASTLLEQPMTKQKVAELASFIEIAKMGMPIGKQDQYASSFGGLNKITFSSFHP